MRGAVELSRIWSTQVRGRSFVAGTSLYADICDRFYRRTRSPPQAARNGAVRRLGPSEPRSRTASSGAICEPPRVTLDTGRPQSPLRRDYLMKSPTLVTFSRFRIVLTIHAISRSGTGIAAARAQSENF